MKKKLLVIALLAVSGISQDRAARITAARITLACAKVRARYAPCYPTLAVPKPRVCSREMDLMQKMLPMMEEVAAISAAHESGLLFFNVEPARDFVETVEAWR